MKVARVLKIVAFKIFRAQKQNTPIFSDYEYEPFKWF